MNRKLTAMPFALLLALALCACSAPAEEPAQAPVAEEPAGVAFDLEGIGSVTLPEGFAVTSEERMESPLPFNYALIEGDGLRVELNRFGKDAYEAAGVGLPADIEEYSTRAGVRQGLPEDAAFEYDDAGNYCVAYTQGGLNCYQALKQGTEAFGAIVISCEGELDMAQCGAWAATVQLD